MKKQIDLAAICFSGVFVFAVFVSTAIALQWTLDAFGIQLDSLKFWLVFVALWAFTVWSIMSINMIKEKKSDYGKGINRPNKKLS